MTRKTYCGNILWQSGLTLLASLEMAFGGVVVYPEYDARIERDCAYAVRVSQGPEKKQIGRAHV